MLHHLFQILDPTIPRRVAPVRERQIHLVQLVVRVMERANISRCETRLAQIKHRAVWITSHTRVPDSRLELIPVVAAAVTVQGWISMCPVYVLVTLSGGFATEHLFKSWIYVTLGAVQRPAVGEGLEDHSPFGRCELVGWDLG